MPGTVPGAGGMPLNKTAKALYLGKNRQYTINITSKLYVLLESGKWKVMWKLKVNHMRGRSHWGLQY